jgi:hypothetical protein
MTIDELFAAARESLRQLAVNPLCSREHAERRVREDAVQILDRLEAALTQSEIREAAND